MAGPYSLQNDPGQLHLEAGFGFDPGHPTWAESSNTGLTALAGGGQAGATLCDRMVNTVTVVANIGDSVVLPPVVPGVCICLINAAVNAMQVFGTGTDTINGAASGTGVSQQGSSAVYYQANAKGTWIANGIGNGYSGQYATYSSQTLTANTNNSQTLATPVTAMQANITAAAAANSSVKLPPCGAGMEITIINNGTNTVAVYGNGTDTINGSASTTMGTGSVVIFFSFNSGSYFTK